MTELEPAISDWELSSFYSATAIYLTKEIYLSVFLIDYLKVYNYSIDVLELRCF